MATSIPPTADKAELRRGWVPLGPRSTLERGQLAVLLMLLILTIAAWALTIHQAQTMDMPLGVVPRGEAVSLDTTATADGTRDMGDMGGMVMDDTADIAATGMAGAG
jgi:predicted metal-binding membrane protein